MATATVLKKRATSYDNILQAIGAVQEITIMHAQHRGLISQSSRQRDVMALPLPQLSADVPLDEVNRLLLAGNSAVTVQREGRITGLITRADLVQYYELTKSASKE